MLQPDVRPAPTTVKKSTTQLVEPELTEIAKKVLAARYLMRNESGAVIETPRQLFERVARFVAEADRAYGGDPEVTWPQFFNMMAQRDFEPNTPALVNFGRPNGLGQGSACFVLPVPDTMHEIFTAQRSMAMVHKSGGGVGMSFSRIRPKDDFVKSTTGMASGPVSFMKAFDHTTECVKQSGVRRGANMGILRVDHPDILEFIDCKNRACNVCREHGKTTCTHVLTNFNISVGITDVFMEALTADDEYDLVNPRNGSVVRRLRARDVMERIVHNAWLSGDPGLFFLDRVNQLDPLAHLPGCAIESCNPCGEIPLSPFNACTLGSINLSNFALPHKGGVDLDRLKHVSKLAVHFLDNVLDQNTYPVEEIHKVTHDHRKIGLGVMGYADLLVRLGIPYGSDDGIRTARLVMETITSATVQASEQLAIKRGPFPLFEQSKWAKAGLPPRRNATTTAIAPTGSISIIAGCSGGCEPLFAICQVRHQAEMKMVDFNADFQAVAEREGFWTEQVRQHVMETGSVQGCPSVPTHWREVFKTANEIDVEWHCKMQAAFQEFVHDAVSKTINLREGATTDDVARTYQLAWDLGCKGITVYRDNSRPLQTLTAGTKMAEDKSDDSVPELYPIPTNTYDMKAASVRTPAGKLSVKLGMDKGRPFEVWLDSSRGGTAVNADTEAIGRLASLVLRLDSPVSPARRIQLIADQLGGIGGGDSIGLGSKKIRSLPDGLANALRRLLKTLHKEPTDSATTLVTPPPAPVAPQNGSNGTTGKNGSNGTQQALTFVSPADICPDCHQVSLVHAEGCDTCNNCGFSRC